jgi:hypothetical protein
LKACANNKGNLITLGGVNEVVLIVLTSVTEEKLIKSKLQQCSPNVFNRETLFVIQSYWQKEKEDYT